MTRSQAREHIFKLLYEMQFKQEEYDVEEVVLTYLENFPEENVSDNDKTFILSEVKGVQQTKESLDEEILSNDGNIVQYTEKEKSTYRVNAIINGVEKEYLYTIELKLR